MIASSLEVKICFNVQQVEFSLGKVCVGIHYCLKNAKFLFTLLTVNFWQVISVFSNIKKKKIENLLQLVNGGANNFG